MTKTFTTLVVILATSLCSWAKTISIGTSGNFFTNYYAFAEVGDVLEFTLTGYHTATRVSMDNWNINYGQPLSGGFNFNTPGVHKYTVTAEDKDGIFYVCQPHVSGGMKGQVLMADPTLSLFGKTTARQLEAYPNPTAGKITLGNGEPVQVKVYDQYGTAVKDVFIESNEQVDLSDMNSGMYYITVMDTDRREKTARVVKK